jgi:hypothetical protein
MIAQTQREPTSVDGTKQANPRNVDAFLAEAVKRFVRVEAREAVMRRDALEDKKFRNGDQWPQEIRASRTIEKRPCLTINKMPTFVHQITNDQRQNRPAINVSPVGDKSDPETAKMLRGLIRQIERRSRADLAYDTGFDSAVTMGWGYWRILTEYENETSFDQSLRIERILNAFSVYLDDNSVAPDGSDAQWAFITKLMPRAEFKREYPKALVTEFQEMGTGDATARWGDTNEFIRVAEYFYYEYKERELVMLADGSKGYFDELPAAKQGVPVIKRRTVQAKTVKWTTITAHEVLDESTWPGKHIPIIKVIGDEMDIEGQINYTGIVRAAKDPQRMYNFWVTSETEMVALAPKAPFIGAEGQFEGHEQKWKQANNKSYSYLEYKPTSIAGKAVPPPQRQPYDGPPQAIIAAKMAAAQDMQAVTGIRFDATLQERMYDESGKALRELKRVSDIGSFHYIDNLARSLRYTGVQLIDLIPKVYDTERVLTILREDDSEEKITIDPNLPQPYAQIEDDQGGVERLYNPTLGEYEVAVTIGPNFATKRAEAADSMMLFLKAVPQAAPVVADLIAKNMDWPGADEIAERLETQLPPAMLDEKLKKLPPEARGIVSALTTQMQQMQQEHQRALAMLGDKEADRQIERDRLQIEAQKVSMDHQAAMDKIASDYETKIAAIMQKAGQDGQAAVEQAREQAMMDREVQMTKINADYQAKLDKITADMQIEMQRLAAEQAAQREQMQFDSEEGEKEREFQGEQSDADRSFEGGENDAERGLKAKEGDKERKAKAQEGKAQQSAKDVVKRLEARIKELEQAKGKPKKIKLKGPSGKVYEATVE